MSFQIIDDILDFSPNGAGTGKPSGNDLSQGIYTLPVILALKADRGDLARQLQRAPHSSRSRSRAARLIRGGPGIEAARAAAGLYTARALRAVEMLPPVPTRDVLRSVTEQLLRRTY